MNLRLGSVVLFAESIVDSGLRFGVNAIDLTSLFS